MSEPLRGTKWRHKKRGTVYEIVDDDASIQISGESFGAITEALEDEVWIAYRDEGGHRLYFRMREEFLDGRFERVPE